ncbi:hypothetical protein LWI28_019167 [Acer negundo]|uniref:Uncharacterized protein n=1 Tax=Acer negundo TaxID=4023 RepID=A0AAD5NNM3_ACENE|nr:hypothetical protein LWI28_019167 [Acer negundo]
MARGNASSVGSSSSYGAQGPRFPMEDTASLYLLYNGDHSGLILEECQWDISSSISSVSEAVAFNSKNQLTQPISTTASSFKPKRDRPVCTHCGVLGHTIEKCYKLHGYPPGYKTRPKSQPTKSFANQTSLDGSNFSPLPSISAKASSVSSLTLIQCQQLIALLSS